jgi:hypothetical protein
MTKAILLLSAMAVLAFSSCEDIDGLPTTGLTQDEVAQGLREALKVSTDTSVTILNKPDGYFLDQTVKILLPPEASVIISVIGQIPGGNLLLNETILAINRAAEDAAVEAKPIFVNAITGITITDAFAILNGHDSSATYYLHTNTYDSLVFAFSPKINASLGKPLVGNTSAASLYADLVSRYNVLANASFGLIKPITQNTLGEYTTTKALDGLFKKVTIEEGKIRNDVSHRVSDILQRVFK